MCGTDISLWHCMIYYTMNQETGRICYTINRFVYQYIIPMEEYHSLRDRHAWDANPLFDIFTECENFPFFMMLLLICISLLLAESLTCMGF